MRVYLDDVRPMPDDFDCLCLTANEAINLLRTGLVTHISFDHDLGEPIEDVGSGYMVASKIEEWAYGIYKPYLEYGVKFPPLTWEIHSGNPVGRENIRRAMVSAERFWTKENRHG